MVKTEIEMNGYEICFENIVRVTTDHFGLLVMDIQIVTGISMILKTEKSSATSTKTLNYYDESFQK